MRLKGSSSNDDNGNESVIRAICLGKQNNNFAHESWVFVHFFDVVEDMNTGKVTYSPLEINSRQKYYYYYYSPTFYRLKDKE